MDQNSAGKKIGFNLVLWIFFSIVYAIYLTVSGESWATPDEGVEGGFTTIANGFYASTIIHTSVGFGDFYPKTLIGKMLVALHAFLVFFINLAL